jgi:hypothetical protein
MIKNSGSQVLSKIAVRSLVASAFQGQIRTLPEATLLKFQPNRHARAGTKTYAKRAE